MNFIVSSGALLKQLNYIGGAIGTSVVLPILEDFLFDIQKGTLTLSATDLETSLSTSMSIESSTDGKVAIPGRMLLDTLKILPDQPITFKIDKKNYTVELTTSNGKYKMNGENGEEFPRIPIAADDNEFVMTAHALTRAVSKTLFALSSDQMRPAMTGMLMQVDANGATFVGTDAHKLVKFVRNDVISKNACSLIIPKKSLSIIKNILSTEGDITLNFDKNNLYIQIPEVRLVCRLIDATYPNFNAVIPTNNLNVLHIHRSDLLNACRRLAIYSNKSSNQVVFKLSGNDLQLNTQDIDFAHEANERMSCDYNGADTEIAFNNKFLIDTLGCIDTENVRIEFSSPNRAILILPQDDEDNEHLTTLVMPIMVNN